MAVFWYAMFVFWSDEKKLFGVFRRPIHGLLLCGLVVTWMWLSASPRAALFVAGAISLVVGFFADKWVRSL